jgi:hypothetical protein
MLLFVSPEILSWFNMGIFLQPFVSRLYFTSLKSHSFQVLSNQSYILLMCYFVRCNCGGVHLPLKASSFGQ